MNTLGKLCLILLLVGLFVVPVNAAVIAVDEYCRLADAIKAANADAAVGGCPAGDGADVIMLSADLTLEAELPRITTEIRVEGGGYSISGARAYRIFYVEASGTLTIEHLTMVNGRGGPDIEPGLWSGEAGAVYNDGKLTISDCTFSNNKAGISGAIVNRGALYIDGSIFKYNSDRFVAGAIGNHRGGTLVVHDTVFTRNWGYSGGALSNFGEMHLTETLFEDNEAMHGGAITNTGESHIRSSSFSSNFAHKGGAIFNTGEQTIIDSSFSGNHAAQYGGAIENEGNTTISQSVFIRGEAGWGGAINNRPDGVLKIEHTIFKENTALDGAVIGNLGATWVDSSGFIGNSAKENGGAIHERGQLRIDNSSFSDNRAANGGALYMVGNKYVTSNAALRHVTMVANVAEDGGGIYVGSLPHAAIRVYNSVLAYNVGGDCVGGLTHSASNLIEDGSCDADFSGDPMLGVLVEPEDNSPAYFPLLAGSPAIDAAISDFCPATDQIGTTSPQGEACDIGAIEFIPEK